MSLLLLLLGLHAAAATTTAFVPSAAPLRHHLPQPNARAALRIPGGNGVVASWPLPEQQRQPSKRGIGTLYSTTSSSSNSSPKPGGGGAAGAAQTPQPPTDPADIKFSDDWKTMVEEGIPIDLEAILADAPILQNEHGTVFLDAFKRSPSSSSSNDNPLSFLRRLLGLGHRTKDTIVEIKAGDWWGWTAAQQQDFLETQLASSSSSSSPSSTPATAPTRSKATTGASTDVVAAPCLFRLRHPVPGFTSRLAYYPSTGAFRLAEKPWFETTQLYTWWLPLFVRVLLRLARPLYAPLFCLKWMGLRAMILWRSFSQFILPSAPYLTLFSFRALYMLGACMLVTVALDELMRPAFEWTFRVLFRGMRPYPDLAYYSLEAAAGPGGPRAVGMGGKSWRDRLWMDNIVK